MDRKKTAKKPFSAELAYILGIAAIAFATALMERADFGMSMVVAPAYILHVWISRYAPWYTFGMPGSARLRGTINQMETMDELLHTIDLVFA